MSVRDSKIVPLPPKERAELDAFLKQVDDGKECDAMSCPTCRKFVKVKRWGVDWSVKCACGWSACGRN